MSLRLTGENPDPVTLERYPNWEYALDEEDVEGQDETTLRPSADQLAIGPEVAFTAGVARLADGRKLLAFLEVNGGRIGGVTVFENGHWTWSLSCLGTPRRWTPLTFEWLPEAERPPAVSLDDHAIFPLRIESLLRDRDAAAILAATISS